MNFRHILYIICILAPGLATGANSIQFLHLPDDIRLSSKLVNAIYQDDDGFIYFGTASGLDRYDGYSVRSYTSDPADSTTLHDSYVESIVPHPDGSLWICGGGRFSVFDPSTGRAHRLDEADCAALGLPGMPQTAMFDSEGNEWYYVADDGIYLRAGGVTRRISDPEGRLRRGRVCEIVENSPGRVHATLRGGEVVFIEANTARQLSAIMPEGAVKPHAEHLFHAFPDRDGLLWVYSESGLWLYSPASGSWLDTIGGTPLPQGKVKIVTQDRMGRIWIGYEHNGIVIIEKNGNMQHLTNSADDTRSLAADNVTTIVEDRSGTIWVGSRKNGVSIYDDAAFKFGFVRFPDVNCILPGAGGDIWLATDSEGIILWKRGAGQHSHVAMPDPAGPDETIVTLARDSSGHVWAGTYARGMLRVTPDGRTVRRYTSADGLASDNIWSILPMDDGRVLLGTLGAGLQFFNPDTGASKVYNTDNSGLESDFVISLSEARDKRVWMATAYGVAVYDPQTDEIVTRRGNRRGTQNFLNENINQVVADSRGLIWVATRTGLNLYDPDSDSIYTVPTGNAGRYVLGIAEDSTHAMWASVGGSLISIAVSGGDGGAPWSFTTHSYDSSDGLQTCDFNQRSLATLPDGEMMIGGFYGVNSWRPDAIKPGQTAPQVFFTGLSLYNEDVPVGIPHHGRMLLPRRLSDLDRIELNHDDSEFAISFATDSYVKPEKTTYYYRLDGFNEEWQQLPHNTHRVAYTNLAPGHYRLHVRAVSGDGAESAGEAVLDIDIKPPFYATPLAKSLFFILLALSIIGSVWLVHRRDQRISQLRLKEEARRKQEELDQMKFRFFTNVSHELRTPLTLITAPLDSLLKQKFDGPVHAKLEIIHSNAEKLLSMVNQLLDFRKNEMAGHTLNLSRGNIVAFVRGICDNFRALSEKKNIHLTFFSPLQSLNMDFDEDKMGKIITNLLSNAFKFTPDDGRVDVALTVAPEGDMLEIAIADTGCGISDADKQRVFERFFQATDGPAAGGTGIGLSLVAEFTRLHGGSVAVADNAVRGTVFTVRIPVRGADDVSSAKTERPAGGDGAPPAGNVPMVPRLLVVDDNTDLQRFISSELSGEYAVVTACDGTEALREIKRYKPDIIISDLMMEGMDGIELCRRLKSNPDTASIPLLILTAKHEVAAKIEGLTLGADDYMTKPFNIDVLRLRMQKLLDLRGKGARRALIDPEPQDIPITSLDEKLIERAVRYVDANMARTDLSVEELAAELGMSRVHLYKRLKQITGKTPIEFIRLLRLKRAAQLLRESQLNISEIAYNCGFNNPKYFSRYFKDEFGVLPSVYQNREESDNPTEEPGGK